MEEDKENRQAELPTSTTNDRQSASCPSSPGLACTIPVGCRGTLQSSSGGGGGASMASTVLTTSKPSPLAIYS